MNTRNRVLALLATLLIATMALSQTDSATLSGRVTDPQGAVVVGADIVLTQVDTGATSRHVTNKDGLYIANSLRPGRYRITVSARGFKTMNITDIVLNVQDAVSQNFKLQLGSVSETVTVVANEARISTESIATSTVVDRNFAENLPMNGRSFQSLVQLAPGVVVAAVNSNDTGQFNVNGQRATSNYWTVDGVSANVGVQANSNLGNGLGGTLATFSVLGGTNSLVSVDAMQEFRLQTSTFAPEFGRTPGGQVSIVTRSGTNQFHGTAFDFLRNDALDANYWFNTFITPNSPKALPKAQERQNDFGLTLGGPIRRDRTFFFFSYEGLRLRLPQTRLTFVPDVASRQGASAPLQPFLNAYPLPNGPDDTQTGIASFNQSYSNPSTLNAYSLRVDHSLKPALSIFARYNYSPSELTQRGPEGNALSSISSQRIMIQTGTAGLVWTPYTYLTNDFRVNYSATSAGSHGSLDDFGGAIPLAGATPFPAGFDTSNSTFGFTIFGLGFDTGAGLHTGKAAHNIQHQFNVVDSLSFAKGAHTPKIGIDFRRLSPQFELSSYLQNVAFRNVSDAEGGNLANSLLESRRNGTLLFRNLSLYAQDVWRLAGRFTLTYGLRWDTDFAPSAINAPPLAAVTGFNLNDFSGLALANAAEHPYKTTFNNFAPRLGAAYQLSAKSEWETVLRAGGGVFYDLAASEAGNMIAFGGYPYGAIRFSFGGAFPLSPDAASPPPITPASLSTGNTLYSFDPHLKLPYTLQWNMSLEQNIGGLQTVTASYIGSTGRRLLQTLAISAPNANISGAELVTNTANSDYHALQGQFKRNVRNGLQALVSYTLSHSIDTASAGSAFGNIGNALQPGATNQNRASSDYDIRHTLSAGATYELPSVKANRIVSALLSRWSIQNILQVRSAPPVNVSDLNFFEFTGGVIANIRPDLVSGQPLYVRGSQCLQVFNQPCPGGKGLNPGAFTNPPTDPSTGFTPIRQGTTPRNYFRGFGATQWDFAVHREFALAEAVKLQFRTELFNILNHPNFGPLNGGYPFNGFGLASAMLGQSLSGGQLGSGGFDPLYQIGGPRSIQLALKLFY